MKKPQGCPDQDQDGEYADAAACFFQPLHHGPEEFLLLLPDGGEPVDGIKDRVRGEDIRAQGE